MGNQLLLKSVDLPSGYAEKILDLPEWVQGRIAWEYLGIPDAYKRLFDAGKIAIEWHLSDHDKWWRYCLKRSDANAPSEQGQKDSAVAS